MIHNTKRITNLRILVYVLLVIVFDTTRTFAGIELKVTGLKQPVFSQSGWILPAKREYKTGILEIRMGDPLGLRVFLKNNAESESIATKATLDQGCVLFKHDSGMQFILPLTDPARRSYLSARSMAPHESLERDFILYNRIPLSDTYLFPATGVYSLKIVHFTGDLDKRLEWAPDEQGTVSLPFDELHVYNGLRVSNLMTIRVMKPFVGWEKLRNAGITKVIATKRGFQDFQQRIGEDSLFALIKLADRRWLTEWYEMELDKLKTTIVTFQDKSSTPYQRSKVALTLENSGDSRLFNKLLTGLAEETDQVVKRNLFVMLYRRVSSQP